jgi:hypothetical protein
VIKEDGFAKSAERPLWTEFPSGILATSYSFAES